MKKTTHKKTKISYKVILILMPFLGALNIFAFTPYEIFWLPFFTTPLLMLCAFECNSSKKAFLIGWLYGFGFLGTGLYWFSNALLTKPDAFGWLFPLSVITIPAILALYFALFIFVVHKLKSKSILKFYLSFCFLWVMFEILRTYLFSGFPWLSFGYIYGFNIAFAQSVSVAGIFGSSLVAILSFSSTFILFKGSKKASSLIIVLLIFVNLSMYFYGQNRLQHQDKLQPYQARIIQPNIQKFHFWNKASRMNYLAKLLQTSKKNLPSDTKYIIWPEIPIPLNLFQSSNISLISKNLPNNVTLLSNSLRFSNNQIFNSSILLNNMSVLGHYDKKRLVPFGEYLPFRDLPIISKLTDGSIDFTPGSRNNNLYNYNERIKVLICFEAFFPVNLQKEQPTLLVNLTNDAWYGNSQGPFLHYQLAQFRAIETSTPLIRAANSGISALFDSRGRAKKSLLLNTEGVLDFYIINSGDSKNTYQKYKKLQSLLFIIIMILIHLKNLKAYKNVHENEKR